MAEEAPTAGFLIIRIKICILWGLNMGDWAWVVHTLVKEILSKYEILENMK
jgi:hypothetical protein